MTKTLLLLALVASGVILSLAAQYLVVWHANVRARRRHAARRALLAFNAPPFAPEVWISSAVADGTAQTGDFAIARDGRLYSWTGQRWQRWEPGEVIPPPTRPLPVGYTNWDEYGNIWTWNGSRWELCSTKAESRTGGADDRPQ